MAPTIVTTHSLQASHHFRLSLNPFQKITSKESNMSFYPPGWDYERVMNFRNEDFATLTEEQHTTLLNGLKEAGLYQAFEDKVIQRVQKNVEAKLLAEEATKSKEQKLADREICAPYIGTLKNVFKFKPDWSEWGFVVFRATPYGPEADAQWAEFVATMEGDKGQMRL